MTTEQRRALTVVADSRGRQPRVSHSCAQTRPRSQAAPLSTQSGMTREQQVRQRERQRASATPKEEREKELDMQTEREI